MFAVFAGKHFMRRRSWAPLGRAVLIQLFGQALAGLSYSRLLVR